MGMNGEAQPLLGSSRDERGKKFNQYLAAISANIIGLSFGNVIGWSSPAIAKFQEHTADSPLDFIPTTEQLSWIGSLLSIGGFFGILFAPLPEWIGRKWSLLVNALLFISSFLILIYTQNITAIYIARFIQGFAAGVCNSVLPMYVGEIASPDCRGILSSFIQIGIVLGILYTYCVGPFVNYVLFQWLCLSIPVIFIAIFIFLPDTPYYYAAKGKQEEAIKSLVFLRQSYREKVMDELEEIETSIAQSSQNNATILDVFVGPNLKAFTICFGLICFQNVSGIDAILFFNQTIFDNAGTSIQPAIASIIIASVMLISAIFSQFCVESFGRKKLLLISSAGMALSLITMGFYFYLDDINKLGFLPVLTLVSFILFYCFGFGPLPYTIMGEMFAPEIKSLACSITVSASWLVDFGITKSFLPIEAHVGSYGNFWIFAVFCVFGFIFTSRKVFETKGLSLAEIQNRLNGRQRTVN